MMHENSLVDAYTHAQLLDAIANAAKVYHNSTGAASCLNVSVDPAGGGVEAQGWDFQVLLGAGMTNRVQE